MLNMYILFYCPSKLKWSLFRFCSRLPRLWPCRSQCHEVSPCTGRARSPVCRHVWLFLGVRPAHRGRPEPSERRTAAGSSAGVHKFVHGAYTKVEKFNEVLKSHKRKTKRTEAMTLMCLF